MNKISPRPWKLIKHKDEDCYWLEDVNGDCICDTFFNDDVEHIVKCVNEHDSLVAEVEELKKDLNILLEKEEKRQGFTDAIMDENNKLNIQNKQLRETLKKCSPYDSDLQITDSEKCVFCGSVSDWTHTADCEYVRLTEESK